MKQPETPKLKTLEVLIHIVIWTIAFTFPLIMMDRNTSDFTWSKFFHHTTVISYYFIAFYFNYFFLIPHYLFRERTGRFILYNILLIGLLSVVQYLMQTFVFFPPNMRHSDSRPIPPRWVFIMRDSFTIAFSVALSAILRISKRWKHIEAARREAEKNRTEAELKNLRNQLSPHFLLNTLNNIYALIAFDSSKAQQAVQDLSKLLRHMLYDNQQLYVSLGKEADFIRNYIELMRIRLTGNVKLETHIDVDANNTYPIAPMLFISLIENAFKHGISSTDSSYISISLSEKNGIISCNIVNSNNPKTDNDKSGSGIGLQQVTQRLELLYPDKYKWEKGVSADGKEHFSNLEIEVGNL